MKGSPLPRIHVCSLALIDSQVEATGARSLMTLLSPGTAVARPAAIAGDRHLYVAVSDIVRAEPGQILPEASHVQSVLDFALEWDRQAPMLIHCFAGVSRSTAAAFISACALAPRRDETAFAQAIRLASPTASPNSRMVALADAMLERNGRMVRAIAGIGRGEECFEGKPFALELR